MVDFVSLTCPSCSGKLQIGKDLDRFACGYCGTEFVVNRGGGVISLSPVVEGLRRVARGVDRTTTELAIARLRQDIDDLAQIHAAIGVGVPFGWILKIGIPALIIGFVMLSGGNWEGLYCSLPGLLLTGGAIMIFGENARKKAEIEAEISAKWSEINRLKETL